MKLCDYPFEVVQFSCGKCLRSGRYKKSALIEKYTADIPLPDLRSHIAHDCERMMTTVGTNLWAISYPYLLKANLDKQRAAGATENELWKELRGAQWERQHAPLSYLCSCDFLISYYLRHQLGVPLPLSG